VYITFGGIKWDYGILMMITAFSVTILGQKVAHHMIDKLGRRSVVVIAIAILVTAGAAIMAYEIWPAVYEARTSGFLHGNRICS
jgi:uncharacterized membrane protein YfcA